MPRYSAADLLVKRSRHDNVPNTVVESHAWGAPVVAFNIGGLPDVADRQRTGYLAHPHDPEALAVGIQWVLSRNESERQPMRENAHERAMARFDSHVVAKQYVDRYEKVLQGGLMPVVCLFQWVKGRLTAVRLSCHKTLSFRCLGRQARPAQGL